MKIGDSVKWFEGNQWHYGIIRNQKLIISLVENIHTKAIHHIFTSKLKLHEKESNVSNYNSSTS